MQQEINDIVAALEHEKDIALSAMAVLGSAQMNVAPAPGKWSPAQILFHVIITEQFVAISLKRSLRNAAALAATDAANGRKAELLTAALRSNRKFVAPEAAANVPETIPLEELQAKWNKVRNELAQLAENALPANAGLAVFNHPFAGPLNTLQSYTFMLEHLRHHQRQILPEE